MTLANLTATVAEIRLCAAADVPPLEGRSVTVAGRRVAVFNTTDGFRALDAACPHKAGPLADGILSDSCVVCPLHGWRIDLTTGEVVGGGEGRVERYAVTERDGAVYLLLDERFAAAASP